MHDPSEYSKRRVPKGRRIFNEGDMGDVAYIVETGEIGIVKNINGSEVEITSLLPGEIFGEISVLDGRERMATAIALVDSSLVVVSPKALEARIANSDKFVKTLLTILMSNLRNTHQTYKQPKYSYEGHVKSIERHCNALADIAHLTDNEEFVKECDKELKTIREKYDNLRKLNQKYKT